MKEKTKSATKIAAGTILVFSQMLELREGHWMVFPSSAQALGYDVAALGLTILGLFWLVSGVKELRRQKPSDS